MYKGNKKLMWSIVELFFLGVRVFHHKCLYGTPLSLDCLSMVRPGISPLRAGTILSDDDYTAATPLKFNRTSPKRRIPPDTIIVSACCGSAQGSGGACSAQ